MSNTVSDRKKSDHIPQFYFPKTTNRSRLDNANTIVCENLLYDETKSFLLDTVLKEVYKEKRYLTETEFHDVTKACCLPQYMNLAFFRAINMLNGEQPDMVSAEEFKTGWNALTQDFNSTVDNETLEELIFHILKKPNCCYITPDDIYPVLEDVVLNHPSLQFLNDNLTFQDRYIETVICRIFYDAHCLNGRLNLKQFRKSRFPSILLNLTPAMDLYTVNNVFSYKQFYVIYYKLWALDTDHDLAINESDLYNYNMGTLTPLSVRRVMEFGHIFGHENSMYAGIIPKSMRPLQPLSYFDFIWFLLSEVDKSTPMAIEYWFHCLDLDNDGIITTYELSCFWQDQDRKQQQLYGSSHPDDDYILFDDIIREMNDLIRPEVPGQFYLRDLKKNGFTAERFFDTFVNFDRLRVHDSRQEGSVRQKEAYLANLFDLYEPTVLTDDLGIPVLCNWNDYANIEYQRIIADESYVNSYEENEENDPANYAYCTVNDQPNYYCNVDEREGNYYLDNENENPTDLNSDDYSTSQSSSPSLSSSDSSEEKILSDIVSAAFAKLDLDASVASCEVLPDEAGRRLW